MFFKNGDVMLVIVFLFVKGAEVLEGVLCCWFSGGRWCSGSVGGGGKNVCSCDGCRCCFDGCEVMSILSGVCREG